jgi:hypothetical protein
MQSESWSEAWGLLERAVAKGGLKGPGNAELLLGIAYYNDDQVGQARSAFQRATQYDKTQTAASNWITHIDTETAAPPG